LLLLAAAAHAQGGPGKVAYVAPERLYAETKEARSADARIAAEFSGRARANQEMLARLRKLSDTFEADEAGLDEPERTRRRREVLGLDKEVRRKEIAYRDDLQHRKNEERELITVKAYALIGRFAEQEKIDVVLFRDVLWARPGVDITDNIIRHLDK
jgi:outer membrane protein